MAGRESKYFYEYIFANFVHWFREREVDLTHALKFNVWLSYSCSVVLYYSCSSHS